METVPFLTIDTIIMKMYKSIIANSGAIEMFLHLPGPEKAV